VGEIYKVKENVDVKLKVLVLKSAGENYLVKRVFWSHDIT